MPISNFGSEFVPLRPIYVVLDESAMGVFTAASYDLELVGQGDTEFEAIDDLKAQVVEIYSVLREQRDNLSQPLAGKLMFFESLEKKS